MSLSISTSGDTADFTPAPVDDADQAWLLRELFAEPTPEADRPERPCGFDAAFDRLEARLAQFEAEAVA